MKIIFYDGSVLECEEIMLAGNGRDFIVDGFTTVPMLKVLRIVSK